MTGCRLTLYNTEIPTAAVSHWAPACLGSLWTHQQFWAEVRSLEELMTFLFLRWSPSFPWYLLLGMFICSSESSPSCQDPRWGLKSRPLPEAGQAQSCQHQKGVGTRTSMGTPHTPSQAERRIYAVQGTTASHFSKIGCSEAMKPPPARQAAGLMQSSPGLSWGNRLSICCSPHSSVLHHDTSSRKREVEPGQGTATPTKHTALTWLPHLCSSPASLVLPGTMLQCRPGAKDTLRDTGTNPPCLGARMQGKAGDGNTKEQRQTLEEEMCPAHTAHVNLHEHPKNTMEAPAPTRREVSGSRRVGCVFPSPTVQEPSATGGGSQPLAHHSCLRCRAPGPAHIAPKAPWSQGCHGCHVEGRLLVGTAKSERRELELV